MNMSTDNKQKRRKLNVQDASHYPVKELESELAAAKGRDLCTFCKNVPWQQLAKKILTSGKNNLIVKIASTHDELQASKCSVCRTLALIKPANLDRTPCYLRSFSARSIFGRVASNVNSKNFPIVDSTMLGVLPSGKSDTIAVNHGFLAVLDSDPETLDFGPRQIAPGTIDFSLVKEWISLCSGKHVKSSCAPGATDSLYEFRVIDCETRSVVAAPANCQYVALSYVWGLVQPSQGPDIDSSPFPLVVEDSVSVTLSLGYRYLWVDRYCVDQNDRRKHLQICQMDKIYSCSQLTLIAAAGKDANYGLPGVSSRLRQRQGQAVVHGAMLLQIFPHPASVLKDSVWAKRGWTYQEGYLSNRRLIFTDYQVSFLCNGMHIAESVKRAPFALNCFDNKPFLSVVPSQSQSQNRKKIYALEGVGELIAEYSARQLTYDSDAIMALLGILHVLERRGIYHIWGVPYEPSDRHGLRLDWYQQASSQRRAGFPTWSWAGWTGSSQINDRFQDRPRFDIHIGPESVSILSWPWESPEYGHEPYSKPPEHRYLYPMSAPRFLDITAPILKLSFKWIQWSKEQKSLPTSIHHTWHYNGHKETYKTKRHDGLHAVLPMSDGTVALSYVYLDDQATTTLESGTCGAVLCNDEAFSFFHYYIIILKTGEHEGFFERVGLIQVRHVEKRGTNLGNPLIGYVDGSGNVLDDVDLDLRSKPLWLEKAEVRNIKLG